MAGIEFFQTRMGQTFYEGTMPRLVRELEKLNKNLENLRVPTNSEAPRPTGWEPEAFRRKLTEVISSASKSGEAAGSMLAEHIDDMHDEDPNVIISELENVIEWARSMLKDLK